MDLSIGKAMRAQGALQESMGYQNQLASPPTIEQQLLQKRVGLAAKLEAVDRALALLAKNPDIGDFLDAYTQSQTGY